MQNLQSTIQNQQSTLNPLTQGISRNTMRDKL